MKLKPFAASVFALAAITGIGTSGAATASAEGAPQKAIPHYQHIVEIMMENTSYGTIIGNSNAPNINTLASTYGLATDYFGVIIYLRQMRLSCRRPSIAHRQRFSVQVGGQFNDELFGVDPGSVDEARLASTQKRDSEQEHAGRFDYAPVVADHPLAI